MAPNSRLAHAGYVVAAYLAVFPLVDAVTPFLPPHFGDARWRFTLFGMLSNTLLILLLALLVGLIFAHVGASLRAKRVVGWFALATAVLTVLCAAMFIYGYVTATSALPEAARHAAVPVTIVALAKYVFGFAAAALLARASRVPLYGTVATARA